jgi:hypothetical protein
VEASSSTGVANIVQTMLEGYAPSARLNLRPEVPIVFFRLAA